MRLLKMNMGSRATFGNKMAGTDGPWGRRTRDGENRKHLTEAGVALDGSLIAAGFMSHPIDEKGYFPSPDAHLLRISRVRGFRIVRCRASREPSGFLSVKEYGSELHLPSWLADLIHRALKHGVKEPIHVTALQQDGALSDSTSTIKTRIQPLTNWVMHIEEDTGAIKVALSATLHATVLEEWNTSRANHWTPQQQAKIEVNFSIDAITRIACFGSYVPALDDDPKIPAQIPALSKDFTLNISNATIGTFAQFAISDTRWIHFYENAGERKSISITEHAPPRRTAQGFLHDSRSYRWPRVSIYGIDMEVVVSAIANSRKIRIVMENGRHGEVYYSHGSDGHTTYDITYVRIDLILNQFGLNFDYEIRTEKGSACGEFCLMWEMLLLRYPLFARYRDTLY